LLSASGEGSGQSFLRLAKIVRSLKKAITTLIIIPMTKVNSFGPRPDFRKKEVGERLS